MVGLPPGTREPVRREDLSHSERGRRGGVDDADLAPGDVLDLLAKERVMRAPEKQRVDDRPHDSALAQERLDVLADRGLGLGRARSARLDEGHQPRAGLLRDVHERVEVSEGAKVRTRADGEGGREDPHGPIGLRPFHSHLVQNQTFLPGAS